MIAERLPAVQQERQGPLVRLVGLRRRFGSTEALRGLDLDLHPGTVVGVAGPNGAGKSTLARILAGEDRPDEGTIEWDGEPWRPTAQPDRVAIVHQEPQLWPNLSLVENMLVGRERQRLGRMLPGPAERGVMAELDIDAWSERPLAEVPLGVRQRAEIARALLRDARLVLFDEPNSALTEDESVRLFAAIHDLAARGCAVILVSHRLAELVEHCDPIVIVRDGRVGATLRGADRSEDAIARELVVGIEVAASLRERPEPPAAPVVSLRGFRGDGGLLRGIDLDLFAGAVTAIVGVEGSGAREFAVALGSKHDPGDSAARTTAYLPADRAEMLCADLSVGHNLVLRLGAPEIATRTGLLQLDRLAALARSMIERYRIRAASEAAPLASLSGGNQQKVAIAAAVAVKPDLLVVQEPTRGVDVGSKAEIYATLRTYARSGRAVVVVCTEVPEVFELADRCLVMDEGRVAVDLDVHAFNHLVDLAEAIASPRRAVGPAGPPTTGA